MANAFNDMTERLVRALDAQRDFVANASHQLRTPLTGLRLRLESASLRAEDPDLERDLVAGELETERLAKLLSNLLRLAQDGQPAADRDLDRARATWPSAPPTAGATRPSSTATRSSSPATGEPHVRASTGDLDTMVDNLVENALNYTAPDTPIRIEWGHDAQRSVRRRARPGRRRSTTTRPSASSIASTAAARAAAAPCRAPASDWPSSSALARRWGARAALTNRPGGGARAELRFPAAVRRRPRPGRPATTTVRHDEHRARPRPRRRRARPRGRRRPGGQRDLTRLDRPGADARRIGRPAGAAQDDVDAASTTAPSRRRPGRQRASSSTTTTTTTTTDAADHDIRRRRPRRAREGRRRRQRAAARAAAAGAEAAATARQQRRRERRRRRRPTAGSTAAATERERLGESAARPARRAAVRQLGRIDRLQGDGVAADPLGRLAQGLRHRVDRAGLARQALGHERAPPRRRDRRARAGARPPAAASRSSGPPRLGAGVRGFGRWSDGRLVLDERNPRPRLVASPTVEPPDPVASRVCRIFNRALPNPQPGVPRPFTSAAHDGPSPAPDLRGIRCARSPPRSPPPPCWASAARPAPP